MADAPSPEIEEQTPPGHYLRLVVNGAIIGVGAGFAALLFILVTDWGIGLWFTDDPDYSFGGGEIWWIGVTTVGGALVGLLRAWSKVPKQPAGTFDAIRTARVDYRTAPQLILVSVVSLISGASLGPFDAGARAGGAIGEWFSDWRKLSPEDHETNALSGTAGGIGALLTGPIVAPLLILEMLKPKGSRYYTLLVPSLVAATSGFFVFYLTVGNTFLDAFRAPGYDLEIWHLGAAVLMGALGAGLAMTVGLTVQAMRKVMERLGPVAKGTLGGAILGVVGVLVPLAMFSGKDQLSSAVADAAVLGGGLLVVAVVAKIFLMATALSTGFIGGPVMPLLAIGGLAGLALAEIFPALPQGLALSAMLVAVPGAVLEAPFAAIALAAITVGLPPDEFAPVGFAVVTAFLIESWLRATVQRRRALD